MKNILILLCTVFISLSGITQCTTLSNNYVISLPTTACSGTYSGVKVWDHLTVPTGKTLTLTSAQYNSATEITVQSGGILNITPQGGTFVSPNITLLGTGRLTVTGNLTASFISGGKSSRLTVSGNLLFDGDMTMDSSSITSATIGITAAGSVSFASTSTLSAASLYCYYGGDFSGKTTISGTTTFDPSLAGLVINSCKFQTATLTNNATNPISGNGYIKITTTFGGTNSLTTDSNIRIYKAAGSGNAGSATVLGAAISPEPC